MTHYEVLGVAPGASMTEIRAAYRAMARRLHPDSPHAPVDAQVRMARANEAWAVLSDPSRRSLYDAELALAARRASDPGPWRPGSAPPPRTTRAPSPSTPIVQVVGPVFVLLGILSLAAGFVMLRPPLMVFGLLSCVVGLYAMFATAVISLRSGRRTRPQGRMRSAVRRRMRSRR